ncbi:MAG: hypothetical protein AB7F09_27070 [Parvibaculaceae bacterium]
MTVSDSAPISLICDSPARDLERAGKDGQGQDAHGQSLRAKRRDLQEDHREFLDIHEESGQTEPLPGRLDAPDTSSDPDIFHIAYFTYDVNVKSV